MRTRWLAPTLLVALAAYWAVMAIDPIDRSDWVLENLLLWLAVPVAIVYHRRWPLADSHAVALFAFLALHVTGSHWAYSNVPMDWEGWGFERNHFDRAVHTAFGLLLAPLVAALCRRHLGLLPGASRVVSWTAIMALAGIYEVIEWGAMEVVAPELGAAFLGHQGDAFDAQKDMALAAAGALVSLLASAVWPAAAGRQARRTPAQAP